MKAILLSVAALGLLAVPACSYFQDPANIAGATKEEANELRVIKAQLTVTGAYTVLGQQIDKGLVTQAEAIRIKRVIDNAKTAADVAEQAVATEDASTDAKLALLQNFLDALAREHILKGS